MPTYLVIWCWYRPNHIMWPKVVALCIVLLSPNKALIEATVYSRSACGTDILLAESKEEAWRREEVIQKDVICQFWQCFN